MTDRCRVPARRGNGLFTALALTVLVGVVAAPRRAEAAACAQIDTNRDNLTEQERQAAVMLLTQALERNGQAVAPGGCDQTYAVSHIKLGASVSITLAGPQGYRQATARSIEDLPSWYDQMVRSLLTGVPMGGTGTAVTRNNVAMSQMAPNRVEADSLWYLRLGYGMTFGGDLRKGPALGFGYRYELDNLALDLSFLNFMIDSEDNNSSNGSVGVTATWVRLEGLFFLNPTANGSAYIGGGLGWGAAAVVRAETDSAGYTTGSVFSGSGLEGQVTAGFEFLRASTIRMFAQADLTLPFYMAHSDVLTTTGSRSSRYLPTLTFSLGIGWGKGTTRVRVIQ
ncbi:MAG TPA: hypothetical protein VHK64_06345 [Nocardioidaceae bacterium]|nr:hypothetical protein [Nocardioidaceae bacterium]